MKDSTMLNGDLLHLEIQIAQFFNENGDPYRKKAAEMFGVPEEQVTPDQRRAAKDQAFFEIYNSPIPPV